MSVRKTDRSLSGIEFLDNAVKIYKLTLKICMKMPKRYTYLILQPILSLAGETMDYVKKGNSIFVNPGINIHIDYTERRKCFLLARSSLQALITRFSVLLEEEEFTSFVDNKGNNYRINMGKLHELDKCIRKELILLNGILKKDKERYEKELDKLNNSK